MTKREQYYKLRTKEEPPLKCGDTMLSPFIHKRILQNFLYHQKTFPLIIHEIFKLLGEGLKNSGENDFTPAVFRKYAENFIFEACTKFKSSCERCTSDLCKFRENSKVGKAKTRTSKIQSLGGNWLI